MTENKNKLSSDTTEDPMIHLSLCGSTVTIRFSKTESAGAKENVRDILTNAYQERFQRILQQSGASDTIKSQKGC